MADIGNLPEVFYAVFLTPNYKKELLFSGYVRSFLVGAFLTAAGAAAGYLGVRAITDEYGSLGSLDGKPVEGDRGHLMVLAPSSEYPKVWVRAKPSLSEGNIVGWAANPGALVQVREYHGKVYPSDSSV